MTGCRRQPRWRDANLVGESGLCQRRPAHRDVRQHAERDSNQVDYDLPFLVLQVNKVAPIKADGAGAGKLLKTLSSWAVQFRAAKQCQSTQAPLVGSMGLLDA